MSTATAGATMSGDRPPTVILRRRMGISSRWYDATATATVTAIRRMNSGQIDSPVRSPSIHRKIGQWKT